jgi:hypothetical protein
MIKPNHSHQFLLKFSYAEIKTPDAKSLHLCPNCKPRYQKPMQLARKVVEISVFSSSPPHRLKRVEVEE